MFSKQTEKAKFKTCHSSETLYNMDAGLDMDTLRYYSDGICLYNKHILHVTNPSPESGMNERTIVVVPRKKTGFAAI